MKLCVLKKRAMSAVLAAVLALSVLCGVGDAFAVRAAAASKWEGYLKISKPEDLKRMNESGKSFYLTNDIDLSEYGIWQPIESFTGTLDGNGYAIKNLNSTNGGLFNLLIDAKIRNIGLLNVDIRVRASSVGGFAANADGSTVFEQCFATGEIVNVYDKGVAGGLVGYSSNDGVIFCNCWNYVNVLSQWDASGISGNDDDGRASFVNCINLGKIESWVDQRTDTGTGTGTGTGGNQTAVTPIANYAFDTFPYTGGITSKLDATMRSCYNFGEIIGYEEVEGNQKIKYFGALAGRALDNAFMVKCGYYMDDSREIKDYPIIDDIGFPSTVCLAQGEKFEKAYVFKLESTYYKWDFEKYWYMDSRIADGFPILQNMLKYYGASAPKSNRKTGNIRRGATVAFTSNLNEVEIYYTTNGNNPTAASIKYNGSITIREDTTFKVAVFTKGMQRGKVATFNYMVM